MAKEKNLVEDALIQMKNLEEAVAENAKGILASTMKEEIKELVKESIVSEDDDEEIVKNPETGDDEDSDFPDIGDDDEDSDFPDIGDDDEDSDFPDIGDDDDDFEFSETGDDEDYDTMDTDMDNKVIDLSGKNIPDKDLPKVFLSMDENDGIIVKKDNSMINLRDKKTDKEYMIQTESEEDYSDFDEAMDDSGEYFESMEDDMYGPMDEETYESMDEETYESMDEETYESMDEETYESMDEEIDEEDNIKFNDIVDLLFTENSYEMQESDEDDSDNFDEVVYEIEMDDDDEQKEGLHMESMKPKIGKGAEIGKSSKFSFGNSPQSKGGFKEDKKQGTRGVGMGKPKFEFKGGEKKESKMMKKGKPSATFMSGKKQETKEASRTYGFGSKEGCGLRKGITPNRNLTFENENKHEEQIKVLREKNEEYRKALNVFRDKLNEVATFNSNLAYATRLFTEHSTSKQEKINILRRFDSVETLKESKNLYRTIKNELNSQNKSSINESMERKIENSPSSGSASTLIESKTYENPQFLRMKDIMSKIIK